MQMNIFIRIFVLALSALIPASCSSSATPATPTLALNSPPPQPQPCVTQGSLTPTGLCGVSGASPQPGAQPSSQPGAQPSSQPGAQPSSQPTNTGACSAPPGTSPYTGKSLKWDDEFTYTGPPDPSKWTYGQIGPAQQNGEMEVYTNAPANAQVANCLFTITAIYNGGQYTSARINSVPSWLYGRFDIMAKLPCGQGTWPALWMMPEASTYGGWPASGELDIMELSNSSPNSTTILGTEHTAQSGGGGTDATTQVPTDCSAFHLYSMDWETNQIQILVDNKVYNTYPSAQFGGSVNFQDSTVWPFNQAFYFIFNIAVGGTLGGTPDSSAYPQTMQIQYVRVYQ
jgi:beta-glucanase (GH16 family)